MLGSEDGILLGKSLVTMDGIALGVLLGDMLGSEDGIMLGKSFVTEDGTALVGWSDGLFNEEG